MPFAIGFRGNRGRQLKSWLSLWMAGVRSTNMYLGIPRSLVVRLGWTTLGYGVVQFLRLLNNVILARLLAPQILGLMAIVNAIRTGVELLSDVGILQNIVSNPRGNQSKFYDTAWTMQALRGLLLAAVCLLLAVPLSRFFNYPELAAILPVASLFFIFTGFDSTARAVAQKQLKVARVSVFEIGTVFVALVAQVSLALITPTVWALILGGVISGAVTMIASFMFIPGIRHRIMIDPESARQLLRFGKWVFFSSIIYFFAMNFDRLYFAKHISLSQLGVYGIARSLVDIISLFVMRAASTVLYPTVAAAALNPVDLRSRLLRGRRTLLAAGAVGVGLFLGFAPAIVGLLYDPRYSEAAVILPILCVGVWFGVLTSTNDSILMGLSRPAYPALSNAAKLVTYLVGAPLAFYFSGFLAAVAVISAGEIVKYVALWVLSHKEHLHFGRDDLVLTLIFVGAALISSELMHLAVSQGGVTSILSQFRR
jgi:O-antigen/teichoic acid export membrane protein